MLHVNEVRRLLDLSRGYRIGRYLQPLAQAYVNDGCCGSQLDLLFRSAKRAEAGQREKSKLCLPSSTHLYEMIAASHMYINVKYKSKGCSAAGHQGFGQGSLRDAAFHGGTSSVCRYLSYRPLCYIKIKYHPAVPVSCFLFD